LLGTPTQGLFKSRRGAQGVLRTGMTPSRVPLALPQPLSSMRWYGNARARALAGARLARVVAGATLSVVGITTVLRPEGLVTGCRATGTAWGEAELDDVVCVQGADLVGHRLNPPPPLGRKSSYRTVRMSRVTAAGHRACHQNCCHCPDENYARPYRAFRSSTRPPSFTNAKESFRFSTCPAALSERRLQINSAPSSLRRGNGRKRWQV